MNKKLAISFIVVAFIIGVVSGGIGMRQVLVSFLNKFVLTTQSAQIGRDVSLLTYIRANDITNATELLEIDLNSSLIAFDSFIGDASQAQRNSSDMKILRGAKMYRTKFPYKDTPDIDETISNLFLTIDLPNSK
ncbi:MAG TPA: hypothetical protein VHG89_03670 [Verrucomicrobiae bacterium]|nr:hypothetical protein [Verrucomicrobiae bacterium]